MLHSTTWALVSQGRRPLLMFILTVPEDAMSDDTPTRIAVWSALLSGAIGFGLGMLFAPQRGPNARRRLAYQIEQMAAQTGSYVRGLAGPAGASSDARRTRDALVADAQARANNIRSDIDSLLDELKKQREDQPDS